MKNSVKDYVIFFAVMLAAAFALSIPVWMAVGRYQICKTYFPEITRMACMVTTLPALPTRK